MSDSKPPDETLTIKTPIGELKFSANETAEKLSKILIRSDVYAGLHNTNVAIYKIIGNQSKEINELKKQINELKQMISSFIDVEEDTDGSS